MRFLARELDDRLDAARAELAAFVGADADDLAFVPNATTGVNAVLRSLPFAAGDELLTTDHAYNACRNALEFVAGRAGARVVVALSPLPARLAGRVVEAVLDRVDAAHAARAPRPRHEPDRPRPARRAARRASSPRAASTRSSTARTRRACCRSTSDARRRVLHAATATSGSARRRAPGFSTCGATGRPMSARSTISHGANARRPDRSRFRLEFDWTGTGDPTAYLCVPEAIRFLGSLVPGGWPALMRRNRALALDRAAARSPRRSASSRRAPTR